MLSISKAALQTTSTATFSPKGKVITDFVGMTGLDWTGPNPFVMGEGRAPLPKMHPSSLRAVLGSRVQAHCVPLQILQLTHQNMIKHLKLLHFPSSSIEDNLICGEFPHQLLFEGFSSQ